MGGGKTIPAICSKVGHQCKVDMRMAASHEECLDLSVDKIDRNWFVIDKIADVDVHQSIDHIKKGGINTFLSHCLLQHFIGSLKAAGDLFARSDRQIQNLKSL
ncbi:hypothetical protein MFLAVUS_005823 [Mucor flavus]|uniref:Uncharacterized protein n=1 Tax=Mucor flavus TaxID=439312 RepID=A0ABP9YZT3_9FUNG